ncbi:MAG TPA: nitrilase-related carbon-nitrogen hydrolase [Blastocatellia bacterium]|nr:nitrilase-related carbon-nitrogen hydrolase [Blastocatellia bacterium]
MTNIACVQMDVEIGSVAANRERIIERLRSAVSGSAEIVIFPECALTGYCFDSLEEAAQYAEEIDGPTARALTAACRETGAYAIVGFIEREGQALYNAAMVVGPGGVAGSYRKVHLPFLGVDRFLTPGNRPFAIFDLTVGRIGVLICYDASFPEAARALKLMGAELIALPTNWPPGAWRTPQFVINARAQENHINFAAANRVGTERGWQFIGRSMVVDFNGDTIGTASGDQEEILFSQIDMKGSNNNRIVNVAGAYEIDRLADRRPEFYEIISSVETRSRSAS